jgi:hypothetical protein
MTVLDIDWLRTAVRNGRYVYSAHADQERQADDLTIAQIEQSIEHGRIIENYPDTGRGVSCLIAGFSDDGTPIHCVCGIRAGLPVIITTYVPGPPKFKNPFQQG